MKSTISLSFFLIALLLITSCNNNETSKKELAPAVAEIPLQQKDTAIATADNSFNALDWQGVYKGILPCADCDGMETSITLNKELTYSMITTYLGKKEKVTVEKKGSFIWNKEGNRITLDNMNNAVSQYLVGENKLIQLDMNGERINGALAEKYVLKKM